MNEFLKYQRTILLVSALLAGLAAVAAAAVWHRPDWTAGLLLGAGAFLLKIRLDALAILRWSQQEKKSPAPLVRNHFFTYALLGATLVVSALYRDIFCLWATVGGMAIPHLVLMADGVLHPQLAANPADSNGGDGHDA